MPELLSFLITAILVLYIVRSLARIFLPMLFQSVVNKAQQQQQQQNTGRIINKIPISIPVKMPGQK